MHISSITDLAAHGFASVHCPVTHQVMPNMTRSFGDYAISYCGFLSHYGSDTTALVLQGRVFFVLNGYHAATLVAAAEEQGLQGCINLFIENIGQANRLSEHRMAACLIDDPFQLHGTTLAMIGQNNIDRIIAAEAANDALSEG